MPQPAVAISVTRGEPRAYPVPWNATSTLDAAR